MARARDGGDMPKSRKRKTRSRGRRRDVPRGRRRVGTIRPGQDMSDLITDEDRALMHAEIAAGARGDALEAYNCHEAGLQLEGGLYPYMLRELVILGDEAPAWMYSRWCLDLAYRWMLIEHDPRIDDAVKQLLVTSYLDESERLLDDKRAMGEL